MPRTKAPPQPVVPSLAGVTISFASYSPNAHPELGNKSVAQLKTQISNCGGAYSTKAAECTHLIATQAQFDKSVDRIKQAQKNPSVVFVAYEWLALALASSSPVNVDDYLLDVDDTLTNGVPDVNGKVSPPPQITPAKKTSKRSRRQDDDEEDDPPPTKKSKQSAPAKTDKPTPAPAKKAVTLKIPVDPQVPAHYAYTVYVDDNGEIFDATLNKSDSGENNNKFYRIQVLYADGLFTTWTRWGRVGEKGQSKMLGEGSLDEAIAIFHAKFKVKGGITWENRDGAPKKGKYVYLEVNYEDSDDDADKKVSKNTPKKEEGEESEEVFAPSKLPKPVQILMELIFNVKYFEATMAELEYDANKMPLGKLSKKTLLKGYEVLKELASFVADPTLAAAMGENHQQAVMDRSNQYFSLVPHVTGRQKVPVLAGLDSIRVRALDLLPPALIVADH